MRPETTDQALVTRMRNGDADAVADLSDRYGARIQQLAMRYLKNWEDAEEVAQDVLLKVSRRIDAFRGDSALSSWIYRITFNTAMSRLRRMRHPTRQPVPADVPSFDDTGAPRLTPDPPDWSSLADDEVMRAELRARLVEALRTLPEVYRDPGPAPRHSRPLDRRSQRRHPHQAADAEVAAAPRSTHPEGRARRFRDGAVAPPALIRCRRP